MPASFNFSSPTRYNKDSPALTTPSPRSRHPLAPLSFPNDLGGVFRSPFQSPAQAQPYSSSYSISKPQPINPDDEEGRVFASSTSFAQLLSAASSQPLLTPAKPNTARTALSIKNMNRPPEVAADPNPLSTRAGMKRKSNVHCTPLKLDHGGGFQRLGPLPPPKTPVGKADPDVALGQHTTTLRKLRLGEGMDGLEDSGCEMDDDDAEAVLLQKNRSRRVTVPYKGKAKEEEIIEAMSPGGHVSKRRARSRPVSGDFPGQVPGSPGSPLQSQKARPRKSGIATFPSATSYRGRASPASSSSESGSPLPRHRVSNLGAGRPQLKQPPLFSRPTLNRQDNLSAATLFFGPTIPQPDLTHNRLRTNSSVLSKSAGEAHPATKHTRVPSNRHSYAGSTDSFWSRLQHMSPSTTSRQKNGMDTDDEDMSFDGPASSSFSNISDIPSPISNRPLPSKYQESRRASTGNYGDFPTVPGLESPGSDFSLATPALEPHGSSGWPQLNIKIEDESDLFSSSSDGADVDEFIVRTLAAASKGPGPGTKRVPGTPVKKVRTAFLGPDRPWQSAATSKIGLKEECDFRKVPRKSLPAAFPQLDEKRGKRSLLEQCSDSEGEEDSPSGRKNGKYAAASLGLGYPPTLPPTGGPGYTESATGKNGPFFLTRNRWLTRRSSSGAFSSGSESTAQGENTPTRSKGIDWQLPKLRITTSSERSASGSSTSSGIANSPTDRKKRHVVPPEPPRRRSLVERASYETLAVQETSRFERDFETVDELGSGEFGNVIKVRSKAGNDAQVYAIKKSKRFEGVKHRLRLREEVDVLKHLSDSASREELYGGHPNVLAYIDSWEEDEALYIQTELCESGSLSRFLWEYGKVFPRLDESRVWKIIVDLSNGLRFIHGAGVIHLDLKPSNVFITGEGRLKIGDFGMASTWPRPKPTVDELCDESNGGFEREGDKLYLAPEILQGRYSQAADIFSFGMTILETASNILVPDQGESWHRLRREDFSQVDWHGSEELLQLIRQMMHTEPSHRLTVHQVYAHAVVSRARRNMEEAYRKAKKQGQSVFAASPLASVPEGFLEEILGGREDCAMDLSL